jgi:hypothetical protein
MRGRPRLKSIGYLGLFGLALGVWLAAPGCGGGAGNDDCLPGSMSCVCVEGNLCAAGLTCVSGYCVDIGGNDSTSDSNSGDGDTGDGDGDVNVDSCQDFLDCVAAAEPEMLSTYNALYGQDGSCYDTLTTQECWKQCEALRHDLLEDFPDVVECVPPHCGDGKLDHDEMCDSTPECTGTCLYGTNDLECSPITQVGCRENFKCNIDPDTVAGPPIFICLGLRGFPEPYAGIDEACDDDVSCIPVSSVCTSREGCVDSPCCTATCYLGETDEAFGSCPPGTTCRHIDWHYHPTEGDWPEAVDNVGICLP